jgi:hypothetical protein
MYSSSESDSESEQRPDIGKRFATLINLISEEVPLEYRVKIGLVCQRCDDEHDDLIPTCDVCGLFVCDECFQSCHDRRCRRKICTKCVESQTPCRECQSQHCLKYGEVCVLCEQHRKCSKCSKYKCNSDDRNMCKECQHLCDNCCKHFEHDLPRHRIQKPNLCGACTAERRKLCYGCHKEPHLKNLSWCENCKCKRCDQIKTSESRLVEYGMCRRCISIYEKCSVCGGKASSLHLSRTPGGSKCHDCFDFNRH